MPTDHFKSFKGAETSQAPIRIFSKNTEKINRLVLLGNGFDLAHKLPTRYNDFIVWYLTRSLDFAQRHTAYDDQLMTVSYAHYYALSDLRHHGIDTVPTYVAYFYEQGFDSMLSTAPLKFPGWQNNYMNPFKFEIKSGLLSTLLKTCSNANWVEIENTFYEELKAILQLGTNRDKNTLIFELNKSLKFIICNLETYLSTLDVFEHQANYLDIFNSPFDINEFVDLSFQNYHNTVVDQSMILNFNYTSTIENYIDDENISQSHLTVNYIHGKLGDGTNPVIFGFGDELDNHYARFEMEKAKGIFEFIKSFWYFKTSNYHDLIRFIDSSIYQVYIMGHSCGLSDRTMLNMIFEHQNCKSIKIFYHENEHTNDYTKLTQEISRHFKDKQQMRRKIVPFNYSSPMPQVEL